MELREAIETKGYRVIATTTFSDGVSFDAITRAGKRKLVHGDKMPTPDEAMASLLTKCVRRVV